MISNLSTKAYQHAGPIVLLAALLSGAYLVALHDADPLSVLIQAGTPHRDSDTNAVPALESTDTPQQVRASVPETERETMSPAASAGAGAVPGGMAGKQEAVFAEQSPVDLPYLLYTPAKWRSTDVHKWPLLVFLHGQGESGSDPNEVRLQGPPALADAGGNMVAHEFVVVSPQKSPYQNWDKAGAQVHQLVQRLVADHGCDPAKVYLTGETPSNTRWTASQLPQETYGEHILSALHNEISAGGFGAWALAAENPETYAAVVPICGGGAPSAMAASLKSVPLWVFHGVNDVVIPVRLSDEMVKAVEAAGNTRVKYSRITEAPAHDPSWAAAGIPDMPGHASWVHAYYGAEGEAVYNWLLSHQRAR